MDERKIDKDTLRAWYYQAKEGTLYMNKDLKTALAADGPLKKDYKLVMEAWLDAGPGKNIPAQIAKWFQEKADTDKPMGVSDVLVLQTLSTGTNAYYLDSDSVWRHVDFK